MNLLHVFSFTSSILFSIAFLHLRAESVSSFIGSSMAAKSPASSLGRNEPSGFSILPYDILQNLCRVIDEVSVTGNRAHALNELSKTNRFLRDISVAQVFRKLTIRGDWNSATKRLEEMDDFPTIIGNVK